MHPKKGKLKGWHKGTHAHHNTTPQYVLSITIRSSDHVMRSFEIEKKFNPPMDFYGEMCDWHGHWRICEREVYVQTTFLTYHQCDKYGHSCDTLWNLQYTISLWSSLGLHCVGNL